MIVHLQTKLSTIRAREHLVFSTAVQAITDPSDSAHLLIKMDIRDMNERDKDDN